MKNKTCNPRNSWRIRCRKGILGIGVFLFGSGFALGQVSVLNTHLHPLNVTPQSSLQASLLNSGAAAQVRLESRVLNAQGKVVLSATSAPTQLTSGINHLKGQQLIVMNTLFAGNAPGNYLKTHRRLPAGLYTHCVAVTVLDGEGFADEYCRDIDAAANDFLQLNFPYDRDTIETIYPVLVWSHSEPFSNLSEGESFRLTAVELREDQSAEAGLVVNPPLIVEENLLRHQLTWPPGAPKLEPGKRYAWKVEKRSAGRVINQTDAWEFVLAPPESPGGLHFAALKRELDASFYEVQNEGLYFYFDEKYNQGQITCRIFDEKREEIHPDLKNVDREEQLNVVAGGHNQFELDLSTYSLRSGFYYLEAENQKGETFHLRFYMP